MEAVDLQPPPRKLPARLVVQLVLDAPTIGLSFAASFISLLTLPWFFVCDPVGSFQLWRSRAEAPGEVERIEETSSGEGGTRIYRYVYSFRLPDGTAIADRCFSTGQLRGLTSMDLDRSPKRKLKAVVEYDPRHPGTSRLRGGRTGRFTFEFMMSLLLLFPGALLVPIAKRIFQGVRRMHLLRHGEMARAVIASCRYTYRDGDALKKVQLPMAEFIRHLEERAKEEEKRPVSPSPEEARSRRAQVLRGFLIAWIALAGLLFTAGSVVCLIHLASTFSSDGPFTLNGQPISKGSAVLFDLAMLAGFSGGGLLMLWAGRKILLHLSGRRPASAHRRFKPGRPGIRAVDVTCTFKFLLPEGRVVEAQDRVDFTERLGVEPSARVLFDPRHPRRAILLDGWFLPLGVTPEGEWEVLPGPKPLTAILFFGLGLLGGPLLAWVLSGLLL